MLRRRFGHVSNERVLSGPGLINLACALAALEDVELDVEEPLQVAERARSGECRFCSAALVRFSAMLGSAAGDLALTLGARGGIYIGGGLCKRLDELFDRERFRAAFVAKGRLGYFLEPIPTYLVVRRDPGPARRGGARADALSGGMAWPDNPFWDYASALYGRPQVEAACLELQRRHGLDVNLVLLCCWQASRGCALEPATLRRAKAAVASWQAEVVRPLRALAAPAQGAPRRPRAGQRRGALARARRRPAAPRGGARARRRAPRPAGARACGRRRAAGRARRGPRSPPPTCRLYWPFDGRDRHELRALLAQAFPDAAAARARRRRLGGLADNSSNVMKMP